MRAFILWMCLTLAACGPQYTTEYRYTAPSDSGGRICVAQCETSKGQCRVNSDLKAQNRELKCEREARDDYERCLSTAQGDAGRSQCTRRSCSESADYGICESDHRVCFQGCGGVVESSRICTFNCPP